MDNLNNIPSTGNFGDVANKINDNFNKVNIAVETINSKYIKNKGYFPTLAALQTAFPSPKIGDTAYVANAASSSGYYFANVVGGAWVETTTVAPAMSINASEYAKHGYSATPKTLKQVDDSKAESGGSAKTLKEVDDNLVQLAGFLRNYPIKETGLLTKGDAAPTKVQMQEFLVDLHLTGNYNPSLTYSLTVFQRANASWILRVGSATGSPGAVSSVCEFESTVNPEQGDKVTFHKLIEAPGSGVSGTIAVNWSKIPSGVVFYGMYDYNGYGFDLKVWDKSYATYINQNEIPQASTILTTDDISLERVVQKDSTFTIKDVKISAVSYKHERGDSEYNGDASFSTYGLGIYMLPLGKISLISVIKARFWGSADFTGQIGIYKSKVFSPVPTSNTLIENINIPLGGINTDSNAFQTIKLSQNLLLAADEYLYVYITTTTGSVNTKRWTVDSQNPPLRLKLLYNAGTTWSIGSTGFWATPLILLSDENDISKLSSEVEDLAALVESKADDEFIEVNLPDTIYAVVGDTLQLFFRGMFSAINPYNYNIAVNCTKGKQYPRYYEYLPTISDVGTTTLTVTVRNNNDKILGTKTCNLITKNVVKSPTSSITGIIIGDSNVNNGLIAKEAQRRLTGSGGLPIANALNNIAFKGRMNDGGTVGWEGTGGWNWYNYIIQGGLAYKFTVSGITNVPLFGRTYTNNGQTFTVQETNITAGSGTIRCTATGAPTASGILTRTSGYEDATINFSASQVESLNPFWNNGALDFNNYVNLYMSGSADVIYFYLSWNGLTPNKSDFTSEINSAKTLIDHIHTAKPSCKIKIMGMHLPSLNGGMGYAYGANGGYADVFGMCKTIFNMNTAYQSWCNELAYSPFMEFVNVSTQLDSENNMQEADKIVNTRSSKTEKIGTNGVHPATEGYYQIADAVYRNFIANFCQ